MSFFVHKTHKKAQKKGVLIFGGFTDIGDDGVVAVHFPDDFEAVEEDSVGTVRVFLVGGSGVGGDDLECECPEGGESVSFEGLEELFGVWGE